MAKDKTKNASSYRSFPLTDEARVIFEQVKRDENENRRLMGKDYPENSYVFKWPTGTPFAPDYVSRHFRILLKRHNLPHIRFHELRHTCANLLLNKGFTTTNIYGHLDIARKKSMADALSSTM